MIFQIPGEQTTIIKNMSNLGVNVIVDVSISLSVYLSVCIIYLFICLTVCIIYICICLYICIYLSIYKDFSISPSTLHPFKKINHNIFKIKSTFTFKFCCSFSKFVNVPLNVSQLPVVSGKPEEGVDHEEEGKSDRADLSNVKMDSSSEGKGQLLID